MVTHNITPPLRFVSSQTLHRHLQPTLLRNPFLSIFPMPFPIIPSHPVQTFHPATGIISSAPLVEYSPPVFLLFELIEVRLGVPGGILRSLLVRSSDLLLVPRMLLPMGSSSIL